MAASSSSSPVGRHSSIESSKMPDWGKEYVDSVGENPNAVVGIYNQIVKQSGGVVGKQELSVLVQVRERVKDSLGLSKEAKKCLAVIEKCQRLSSRTPQAWKSSDIKPPSLSGILSFTGPKFVPRQTEVVQRAPGGAVAGSSSPPIGIPLEAEEFEGFIKDFEGLEEANTNISMGKEAFITSMEEYDAVMSKNGVVEKLKNYNTVKEISLRPGRSGGYDHSNARKLRVASDTLREAIVPVLENISKLETLEKYCPDTLGQRLVNIRGNFEALIGVYCEVHPEISGQPTITPKYFWNKLYNQHKELAVPEMSKEDRSEKLNSLLTHARITRWNNDQNGETIIDENKVLDCIIDHYERALAKLTVS